MRGFMRSEVVSRRAVAKMKSFLLSGVWFATSCVLLSCIGIPVPDTTETGLAILKFPEDHRLHANPLFGTTDFIDWLYFTGIVEEEGTGREYGFFVTLYRVYRPELRDYVHYFQVSISEVSTGAHPFDDVPALIAATEAGFDPQRGERYWRFSDVDITLTYWETTDQWDLWATNGKEGNDQTVVNVSMGNVNGDYVAETPSAIIEMGLCTQYDVWSLAGLSYYYSNPDLTTTGTLKLDGQTHTVSGRTWMDHQWGNFSETCTLNYDWLSLRFVDGSAMMVFNFRDENQDEVLDKRQLSYFPARGQPRYWYGADAFTLTPLRSYTSTATGRTYPVDWILTTPVGTYGIRPHFDEQTCQGEIDAEPFWEGMCRLHQDNLEGPVIGTVFMELYGY